MSPESGPHERPVSLHDSTALLRNGTDDTRTVHVRSRRNGRATQQSTTIAAGGVRPIPIAPGGGAATVEIHAAEGMVTTTVSDNPPVFVVREGGVLLARD